MISRLITDNFAEGRFGNYTVFANNWTFLAVTMRYFSRLDGIPLSAIGFDVGPVTAGAYPAVAAAPKSNVES